MTDAAQTDGGPVVPTPMAGDYGCTFVQGPTGEVLPVTYEGGMSLRDHFAGQALTRLVPDDGLYADTDSEHNGTPRCALRAKELSTIATDAYAIADAMLAARKATP